MNLFKPSHISLDTIRKPVKKELRIFESYFKESLRSQVPLVDLIARYIIRQKGKRVRPLLVMLSAKLCGKINDRTYRAATLIELLHTATLVHDDVVDDADMRRGIASINSVWHNKAAVLMGDYLLSRGLLLSLKYDDYDFLNSTSYAVKRMSEGELLQIQKSRKLDIDENSYIKIIGDKTASLFSACTEIGSSSATSDPEKRKIMKEYGEYVGLSFQIRDDLLDYLGRRNLLGKPTGRDIKEKKITLPLIYAFENSNRNKSGRIISYIRKGPKRNEIKEIIDFVQSHGGIEYSIQKAEEFANKARICLQSFPNSSAKQSLLKFVNYVMERDR